MTRTRNLRIVLVEDEPLIALLLEELLNEMGHDVCATEATQASAVDAFHRERPDIMIVDCRLREGRGIDAVTEILKDRFVPHIFMTGDDLRAEALDPAAVVLRKPFLDIELSKAIEKALAPSTPPRPHSDFDDRP